MHTTQNSHCSASTISVLPSISLSHPKLCQRYGQPCNNWSTPPDPTVPSVPQAALTMSDGFQYSKVLGVARIPLDILNISALLSFTSSQVGTLAAQPPACPQGL